MREWPFSNAWICFKNQTKMASLLLLLFCTILFARVAFCWQRGFRKSLLIWPTNLLYVFIACFFSFFFLFLLVLSSAKLDLLVDMWGCSARWWWCTLKSPSTANGRPRPLLSLSDLTKFLLTHPAEKHYLSSLIFFAFAFGACYSLTPSSAAGRE